jgi:hypothetical protein
LEKNPQVLDVSDLTIKWMVNKALAHRGNNLQKARHRFHLSWHMFSMQQARPEYPDPLKCSSVVGFLISNHKDDTESEVSNSDRCAVLRSY